MNKIISSLAEGILDLIYPSNIYCISCGNIIDCSRPYALCDSCIRMVKWANGRTCGRCGKILQDGYEPELCTDCLEGEHFFEQGFTCAEYDQIERHLLHQFKYKDKAYVGRKLAEIMFERIQTEALSLDLIIPVPMYAGKERKRGYNQAAILASCLAKRMACAYGAKLLIRKSETEAMSRLGAAERRRNIQEAFTVPSKKLSIIKGKDILLVDDIYTTGSTADSCARVLLEAGARKVLVFTFASGANLIRDGEKTNFVD